MDPIQLAFILLTVAGGVAAGAGMSGWGALKTRYLWKTVARELGLHWHASERRASGASSTRCASISR